jgi:glycosyltransferase involved in cell wall biosynthesis
MKRICMVRQSYYEGKPPTQRNAETLASHGYQVSVICLRRQGEKSREVINGVTVYRLPLEHHRKGAFRYIFEYVVFFWLAFWKLTWTTFTKKFQVIEMSGIPDFLVFSAVVPKLFGTSVILHILDHTPEVFMEHFAVRPGHWIVKVLRFIERTSARWADRVIGTQIINLQMLEERGVPKNKMSMALNVPNDDVFYPYPASNHHEGTFLLFTHGSLLERYGVQTLVKAMPLLIEQIPQLKLEIVGDGEYRPQLEQLAKSLGVSEYINFTGLLPQTEVPRHIAEADIGVVTIMTSLNPMLPNKLFEYLAMGKPAVTTSIPAIKAYFDDSSVMYYEPDNHQDLAHCIIELYRDPEKRSALANNGLASFKKYRWTSQKYEYIRVYDELTADKRLLRTQEKPAVTK